MEKYENVVVEKSTGDKCNLYTSVTYFKKILIIEKKSKGYKERYSITENELNKNYEFE